MNVVIGPEFLTQYSIESFSSIEELRKILFICRSNNVIAPNKKGCSEYNLKYGKVVQTDKGPAIAIGTYCCRLWFQLKRDNGKLSFWDTIHSPSVFIERGFYSTNERVEPQYMTHYELYSILYNTDKYIYQDKSAFLHFSYPVYPSIFLPPKILYSKNQESILETVEDYVSSLPLDMIADIFEYCEPLNVFYSMLVCRSWYIQIKQCGVWKRFCKRSGIEYDEKLLNSDYDGNQAEYYFSHGVKRRLLINLVSDIDLLYDKKYYLGGLYWILNLDDESLYINSCNISFKDFSGIEISIIVKISVHNKNFEFCKKYGTPERKLDLLNFQEIYTEEESFLKKPDFLSPHLLMPIKCSITVKVHGSLISLMYKTILK